MKYISSIVVLCSLLFSCDIDVRDVATDKFYKRSIEYGLTRVKVIQEFNALFPEAKNFISYHGNTNHKTKVWNSEVYLYKTYVLTLQMDVELESNLVDFKRMGPPKFYLDEIEEIVKDDAQRPNVRYSKNSLIFDQAEWNKLYKSKGDFAAIRCDLRKDIPVENFDFFAAHASRSE